MRYAEEAKKGRAGSSKKWMLKQETLETTSSAGKTGLEFRAGLQHFPNLVEIGLVKVRFFQTGTCQDSLLDLDGFYGSFSVTIKLLHVSVF